MGQDWLAKVRALLNQADHPNTSVAEAKIFRAKARELRNKHSIEEWEAAERGEIPKLTPDTRSIDLCPLYSQHVRAYQGIGATIMYHCDARGVYSRRRGDDGMWYATLEATGFQGDLDYLEMLYYAARLHFADQMEPRYNAKLSEAENVYRMRKAGMTRDSIAYEMGWRTGEKPLSPSAAADKASRLYKQECKRRGEPVRVAGQGFSLKTYLETYAESFEETLFHRLWESRNAADTERGAIVLRSRKQQVNEAFYQLYPHLRPTDTPPEPKKETAAQQRRRERKAAKDAYERYLKKSSSAGQAGRQGGIEAAESVELRGIKPARRLEA